MENRISKLFKVSIPIVQGGMVWCSGWQLASTVSNAGGLGLIGSGSMSPELLRSHIHKCKASTNKPFGVNLPLIYSHVSEHIEVIVQEGIEIVFTSAGNPSLWTGKLRDNGVTIVHVVSSVKYAKKAEEAGVDAIVGEGFEAGGHNGREETTTMCLIPMIRDAIKIPLIAAGGIADGRSMVAAFALGAEGVQIGSRFAATQESSAHENFKQKILEAREGDTELVMKELTPVRLLKNSFYDKIKEAELSGKSKEELKELLGKGRAKLGIFEGNLDEGELEIGQVSAAIHTIPSASQVVSDIWNGFLGVKKDFCQLKLD